MINPKLLLPYITLLAYKTPTGEIPAWKSCVIVSDKRSSPAIQKVCFGRTTFQNKLYYLDKDNLFIPCGTKILPRKIAKKFYSLEALFHGREELSTYLKNGNIDIPKVIANTRKLANLKNKYGELYSFFMEKRNGYIVNGTHLILVDSGIDIEDFIKKYEICF